ncbi:MAG: restriction endonuclease subunit S [Hydrogenophaga sp.]|nr:restriction endonuclease subunit S [Hydrogenophaga sp.]
MDGWQVAPLSELTQFINGLWKGEDPPFVHVGVIRNTNFTKDGDLDNSDIAYLDVEAKKFLKRRLQFGDLILEKSGGGPKQPVGRVVLFDKTEGDFSFSNFTAAIRVVNSTALDARFLHKYLHWVYVSGRTETMQSHSTGIRNLNGDAYKAIKVAYPPLTEQRRIVAILDEAFEGIATAKANADKNLQNARELFDNALQSLLHDSDGGRVRRSMADVCDIPSKLVDPREEKYQDSPHVGAGNIETKTGALIDVLTARQEQLISGKFLFDESMVLYSKIRPYLMKVVRPDFNGLCSADIYPLAPKYGVIGRDYLFYLLLSPDFTAYAIKGSARAGMPKVNREHLFAYEFSLPSVQEQEQIAARLDALAEETQRLIAVYERKLAALEELKKSLLHQAFSGQL